MGERETVAAGRRWIVDFAEGDGSQRQLLGGKGANLCEMTRIGLPVPPGFVITTEACRRARETGRMPDGLAEEIDEAVARLEARTGRRVDGHGAPPLLLSVRSGAAFSMPGMMDTVLDLGAGPASHDGLVALGGEWFAWDARRRFLEMFGRVVLGVDGARLGGAIERAVADAGVASERDLPVERMRALVGTLEQAIADADVSMPQDPREQLLAAVGAVFASWDGKRAREYRALEGIPDDLGTAVTVQTMVFGNLDDRSASGVAFSRDPATGEAVPYGDFLVAAQGEDVVAGTRHPQPLAELAEAFPSAHAQLLAHLDTLEQHERDLCDVEFTIEADELWMLQTRIGKRTATAAVRMAVEMVDEGLIDAAEAVMRVRPEQVDQLLHPRFAERPERVLATGLGASPGAAVGEVVLTSDAAVARAADGTPVVLVRVETSPEDLSGMVAATGLLTARGGLVSHAAVVARGMGKPAVCGASALDVDEEAGEVRVDGQVITAGDTISIDGTTGEVVLGALPVTVPSHDALLDRLLAFADEFRRLHVFANADTVEDARRAREAGAEGIGLCRTEHQFLGDRLPQVRRVILNDPGTPEAEVALAALEEAQVEDFAGLLEAMDGLPVVIRLLDPPLHEFLPDLHTMRRDDERGALDAEGQRLLVAAERLWEHNPMLGARGLRLGVLRPAIYRRQVRAVMRAAARLQAAGGRPRPEVMLPMVATVEELAWAVALIAEEAAVVVEETGTTVDYTVATMVETPRAALCAAQLAPLVDAFSFGTNDLTQLTFGLSRDDVETTYVPRARAEGLMPGDPFRTLDPAGVGRLIRLAVDEGRAARPDLVTGICGEHGGDPASIALVDAAGLDHVSCAPSRVRVARLAAARATLGVAGPDRSA